MATELGGLGTAYNFAMRNPLGGKGLIPFIWEFKKLPTTNDVIAVTKANAYDTGTYMPFLVGVMVHWGKSKPVLRIVGRPLDKLCKKYFRRPL